MKEQAPISQPENEEPNPNRYVADWEEGAKLVDELTAGGSAALGSWYRYPEDFTIFYKDALSGEGSGYYIYRNENGKHVELVANIHVGIKPPEGGGLE